MRSDSSMQGDRRLNIVVFSGGRGTTAIHDGLSGVKCNVTFLVNGYDSGLSTGRLRWAFDGLLGPSDFRKCVSTSLRYRNVPWASALAELLEDRDLLRNAESKSCDTETVSRGLASIIAKRYPSVPCGYSEEIVDLISLALSSDPFRLGRLGVIDLPVGNAVFLGCFLRSNSSFNSALSSFGELLLGGDTIGILNITNGEDLWLCAVADSFFTVDEGTIVQDRPPCPISEIFLIPREIALRLRHQFTAWNQIDPSVLKEIRATSRRPSIAPEAVMAIQEADLIVFGNGTQHSSILPSFLTNGLQDAITRNDHAAKLLLGNGTRDYDFHMTEGPLEALEKSKRYLTLDGVYEWSKMVNRVVLARASWGNSTTSREKSQVTQFGGIETSVANKTQFSALDAYGGVNSILKHIVGQTIAPSESLVSVVFPVLNQEDNLPSLLEQLNEIDSIAEKQLEFIFVDYGSADETLNILANYPWVSTIHSVGLNRDRISATYTGISAARGSVICVMQSELEYDIHNIKRLVTVVVGNSPVIAVGSRTHHHESAVNLRFAYSESRLGYWLSRIGGIAVAMALSLRIGRVVSDPFCEVLAGRREDLLKIYPSTGDFEANVHCILNSHKLQIGIVEVGVVYRPRRNQQQMRRRVRVGIRALFKITSQKVGR